MLLQFSKPLVKLTPNSSPRFRRSMITACNVPIFREVLLKPGETMLLRITTTAPGGASVEYMTPKPKVPPSTGDILGLLISFMGREFVFELFKDGVITVLNEINCFGFINSMAPKITADPRD